MAGVQVAMLVTDQLGAGIGLKVLHDSRYYWVGTGDTTPKAKRLQRTSQCSTTPSHVFDRRGHRQPGTADCLSTQRGDR